MTTSGTEAPRFGRAEAVGHPRLIGLRDLDATIIAHLDRFPRLELVVAPDDDIVAASLVALYRQARFATGAARTSGGGARLERLQAAEGSGRGRTLIMYGVLDAPLPPLAEDDLARALHGSEPPLRGAVMATDQAARHLDIVLRPTTGPVLSTWQVAASPWLAHAAITLEGVLAAPPSAPAGPSHRFRLPRRPAAADPVPALRPATDIGVVLSTRPERQRPQTEAWLRDHGIGHRHLELIGGHRTAAGLAAAKARAYRRHGIRIAIDADLRTASRTAAAAGHPVMAWDVQRTVTPSGGDACR